MKWYDMTRHDIWHAIMHMCVICYYAIEYSGDYISYNGLHTQANISKRNMKCRHKYYCNAQAARCCPIPQKYLQPTKQRDLYFFLTISYNSKKTGAAYVAFSCIMDGDACLSVGIAVDHSVQSQHGYVYVCTMIKCEMEILIFSQTSTVKPLKFGNG